MDSSRMHQQTQLHGSRPWTGSQCSWDSAGLIWPRGWSLIQGPLVPYLPFWLTLATSHIFCIDNGATWLVRLKTRKCSLLISENRSNIAHHLSSRAIYIGANLYKAAIGSNPHFLKSKVFQPLRPHFLSDKAVLHSVTNNEMTKWHSRQWDNQFHLNRAIYGSCHSCDKIVFNFF